MNHHTTDGGIHDSAGISAKSYANGAYGSRAIDNQNSSSGGDVDGADGTEEIYNQTHGVGIECSAPIGAPMHLHQVLSKKLMEMVAGMILMQEMQWAKAPTLVASAWSYQ